MHGKDSFRQGLCVCVCTCKRDYVQICLRLTVSVVIVY